jgi:hypothetical protein
MVTGVLGLSLRASAHAQARIEETRAGPVGVWGACRVVAVVDGERSRGDHDERRAGVRMPAGRPAGGDPTWLGKALCGGRRVR